MEAQAEAKRKAQLAQVQCEVWSVELLICSVQNRLVSTVSNQEPFPLSLPTAPLPHPPLPSPAQMGEDRGVARSSGVVSLESNTSRMGRKCDNASCMKREGLGGATFKRCSACR